MMKNILVLRGCLNYNNTFCLKNINFEGNTIFWQNNGSNITLQVTDSLGNVTTITVPLGSFNITGTGG